MAQLRQNRGGQGEQALSDAGEHAMRGASTVEVDVRALRWLSRFLAECHPEIGDAAGLTRPLLEHYLSWLVGTGVAGNSKSNYLVCLRSFLDAARRHGWLPDLPPHAAIYLDDLPPRPDRCPASRPSTS